MSPSGNIQFSLAAKEAIVYTHFGPSWSGEMLHLNSHSVSVVTLLWFVVVWNHSAVCSASLQKEFCLGLCVLLGSDLCRALGEASTLDKEFCHVIIICFWCVLVYVCRDISEHNWHV